MACCNLTAQATIARHQGHRGRCAEGEDTSRCLRSAHQDRKQPQLHQLMVQAEELCLELQQCVQDSDQDLTNVRDSDRRLRHNLMEDQQTVWYYQGAESQNEDISVLTHM